MKTLREQLNHLLRPESCAGEYTMYEVAKIALVAKQMDALLEECAKVFRDLDDNHWIIGVPVYEKLEKAGYGANLGIKVEGE